VTVTRAAGKRRIVLADDHALVRAGIRALLETLPGIEVVGEYGDGIAAFESVRREPPDAILLDITLPGLNGLDVTARITRLDVPTRVLILSMHNSPEHAARALVAGAAGYLNKDSAFDELAAALEAIWSGRRYLCRALNEDAVLQLEHRAGEGTSELELLTLRQRQILQLIAEGHPTRQIAERLFLSIKTVEAHRGQIMQRLSIFDVPGLVRFAIRNGLVSSEPT
jgi:DNA-binding NarL/FixJ family response regulator